MDFKYCKIRNFPSTIAPGSLTEKLSRRLMRGHIGNYDSCMSVSPVTGYWRPLDGCNPYIGTNGEISCEPELKVEVTVYTENVDKTIKDLEKNKTIYGYHTLINWDKTNHDVCTAVIQVNAKPERDYGYDRIAKKIYNFPEVDTMYLLAGNYEFLLIVKGKTMVEVAKFVNSRLAVIEGIERTATMYVLKQYKNMGRLVEDDNKDAAERYW